MAKKKITLKEVGETLAFIVGKMATNDALTTLEHRLTTKIDKLDISIHRELETIKQQLKNVEGFGKEIDHALERIAAIEKHLGLNKKIAA